MTVCLTVFLILLPAIHGFIDARNIAIAGGHQYAATDPALSTAWSTLSPIAPANKTLCPYSTLMAVPSILDVSPAARSSVGVISSPPCLFPVGAQSRAPPLL